VVDTLLPFTLVARVAYPRVRVEFPQLSFPMLKPFSAVIAVLVNSNTACVHYEITCTLDHRIKKGEVVSESRRVAAVAALGDQAQSTVTYADTISMRVILYLVIVSCKS
jgi:uncharacterized heparinase superfamily protein